MVSVLSETQESLMRILKELSAPEIAYVVSKHFVTILPKSEGKIRIRENLMRDWRNLEQGKTHSSRAILDNLELLYRERVKEMMAGDSFVAPIYDGPVRTLLREECSFAKFMKWHRLISSDDDRLYGDLIILFALACDAELIERKCLSRPMFQQLFEERIEGVKEDYAVRLIMKIFDYAKEQDEVTRKLVAETVRFDERTLRRKIGCERDGDGRFRDMESYRKIFDAILKIRYHDALTDEVREAIRIMSGDMCECLLLAAILDKFNPDLTSYSRLRDWFSGQLSVRSCK